MTAVEDYQQRTGQLAASTVAQVAAIYAVWEAGRITTAELTALVAAAVNAANAAASTLADAYVAAHVEQFLGIPTPTVGRPPRDDTDRLVQAVRTILDDDAEVAPSRFERLAHSEPLETAQRATVEVMAAQPEVIGWRRQMDANPCELCEWWYADGRIYKTTTEFRQHPGCNCQPEPVTNEERSA